MAECGEDKNNAVVICIFRVHLENDQGGGKSCIQGGSGDMLPQEIFLFFRRSELDCLWCNLRVFLVTREVFFQHK